MISLQRFILRSRPFFQAVKLSPEGPRFPWLPFQQVFIGFWSKLELFRDFAFPTCGKTAFFRLPFPWFQYPDRVPHQAFLSEQDCCGLF